TFCSTKWVLVNPSARPLAATARVCPRAISSPQGSLRAPSYSSCAVAAGYSPIGSSRRSAVRSSRHARSAISRSPVKRTPPRPAVIGAALLQERDHHGDFAVHADLVAVRFVHLDPHLGIGELPEHRRLVVQGAPRIDQHVVVGEKPPEGGEVALGECALHRAV